MAMHFFIFLYPIYTFFFFKQQIKKKKKKEQYFKATEGKMTC